LDPGKTEPGICGCGLPDTDTDNDGYLLCNDNCPNTPNDQTDTDGDGLGDACDNCPHVPNPDNQGDSDADGVGDVCDNCPNTPDGPELGTCIDGYPSLIGETCTVANHCNAWGSVNGYCSRNQEDADGDGTGDACDPDDDNDGVPDVSDNCRVTANPNQADTDGDGTGDACNDSSDTDGDEWEDSIDNCPNLNNPAQVDSDGNGIGDACEFDLSVKKVELVQVVQDENNSIPLIHGKNTYIRAYLDVGKAKGSYGPVSGVMEFFYEDGTTPMYTFVNGLAKNILLGSSNSVSAKPNPVRENIADSLNFFIPKNWRWESTPYFRIRLVYSGSETDLNPYNNYYGPEPLEFQWSPRLDIEVVPVYSCAGGYIPGISFCAPPEWQDIWDTVRYMENLFPVQKIRVRKGGDHNFYCDPTSSVIKGMLLYNNLWWINLFTNDPFDNMRYYGLVCKELDPLGYSDPTVRGCGNIIGDYLSGSQSGMGWEDQAWGVRQDNHTTRTLGGETMAHEIGHTILGNDLSVPGIIPGHVEDECGARWPYLDYPDTSSRRFRGLMEAGTFGFDGQKVYHPDRYFDIMTYSPCWYGTPDVGMCSTDTGTPCEDDCDCPNGTCSITNQLCRADADCPSGEECIGTCSITKSQRCSRDADCPSGEHCRRAQTCETGRWISSTIYKRIFIYLSWESGMQPESIAQRSSDTPTVNTADAEDQEYLIGTGVINLADGTVESIKFHILDLPAGTDDEPGSGEFSLSLLGSDGSPLFARHFNVGSENQYGIFGSFGQKIPYSPETASIVLKHWDNVLATIPISPNRPHVTVTYPNGGEVLSGEVTIQWTGDDGDGDTLTYDILYSSDSGATWSAITTGLGQSSFVWNADQAAGSSQGLIKILASDGVNTGQDESDESFTVAGKSPEVAIVAPNDNASFFLNETIVFEGRGYDLEDGPLSEDGFIWSSDIDGEIGSGEVLSLETLSAGTHYITLAAEDSNGNIGYAGIRVNIADSEDDDGDKRSNDNDNCPFIYNPEQSDSDRDGVGDVCDDDDSDNDGYPDGIDNCPLTPNDQSDVDGDGYGDACDNPRYAILPDAAMDLNSGLVWQRAPREETVDSWSAAVAYCQALNQETGEAWRLPAIEEFESLTDPAMSNPALPENHPFIHIKAVDGWYWTSTTDPTNSDNAFYVDINDGLAYSFDKAGWLGLAWCVSCPTWYQDADGDGYSSGDSVTQCQSAAGYFLSSELTELNGDCDDNDSGINRGASEICTDGLDNNCNGAIDFLDPDCDGNNVDDDADGLSNGDEIWLYGTSINNPDTDGDGLNDGTEASYWGENWSSDIDGDQLVNLLDNDSDNDGIDDGVEVNVLFTDPALTDTDGDGVDDSLDLFPIDPNEWADNDGDGVGDNLDTDDDNDGMPDTYETENGLNPKVNDALVDSDSDGFINFREFLSGSHPKDEFDLPPLIADTDMDNDVDGSDFSSLIVEFGRTGCSASGMCVFDLDNDDDVDDFDLLLFSEDFGRIVN
jgi:hypothetical protein